jgi:RHS repeat-associated protein
VTTWRHDGLTVTETDPLGRNTVRKHTAIGEVAQVIDPALADTAYAYDAFGNLVSARDALGHATRATFDVLGRRTSVLDSAAGLWLYAYYPLGELQSQVNGRGQSTTLTYDRLSRVLTRVEPEGVTTWTWGTASTDRNVGSLVSVRGPNVSERFTYDALGRPATTTRLVQGASLAVAHSYDPVSGLRDTMTYPTASGVAPLRVRHRYDRHRLVELTDADSGASFWRLDAVDARGYIATESLGNGVSITSNYDPASGLLAQRTAGQGGGSSHQNLAFEWDSAGNLVRRTERNAGVDESFTYDAVNRLDQVQRGGALALDLAYDAVGNLTYKSDVGQYRYDAARGNALVSAGTNSYSYDANGAVANASGSTIVWQSFDLPSRIMHPVGNYSLFEYAPDRSRARQLAIGGGSSTDTLYAAGGLYERVASGSTIKHRNYIVADGRRVAVQTRTAGSQPETVYLLEDQLGGVDGFTSASGELLTRTSYQPFGAHRSGNWVASTPTAAEWQQIQRTTPRGYTGHEHLNNLGVIHMNGRVYDPVLGRFLSPDPIVQAPHDTQGFNRYAYVRNNPLRYTDPSGFCIEATPTGGGNTSSGCLEEVTVYSSRQVSQSPWSSDPFARGMEEVMVLGQRLSQNDLWGSAGDVADALARLLIFDYVEPLGDSYLLEAATLVPGAKAAKFGRATRAAGVQAKRVFWSGGRAAEDAARRHARANGGVVIGDTFAAQALTRSSDGVPWDQLRPVWESLSREFARGASGVVDVFHNSRGLSPDSIWRTEYRELRLNPNVESINYHVVMPDGSEVVLP